MVNAGKHPVLRRICNHQINGGLSHGFVIDAIGNDCVKISFNAVKTAQKRLRAEMRLRQHPPETDRRVIGGEQDRAGRGGGVRKQAQKAPAVAVLPDAPGKTATFRLNPERFGPFAEIGQSEIAEETAAETDTADTLRRKMIQKSSHPGMIAAENAVHIRKHVVEHDLAEALNSGKVYAAGLDVVSSEPIKGDNPLLTAKNCIITPHISWAAKESRQRIMDCTAANIRAYLEGRPANIVNM